MEVKAMQRPAELDLPHLPMETPEFTADPFPHFAGARAKHPWLANSVFGLVVTEYAAMKDLLAMNGGLRTGNDGVVAFLGAEGTGFGRFAVENIFNQQGDAHRRLRDALAPIFTPRHANVVRSLMREVVDSLLDEWAPKGSFDFEEFASYFPISVLNRMIGGPVEAIPGLRSSLEAFSSAFGMDRTKLPEIEAAVTVVEDFAQSLIAGRRANASHSVADDLLDMLIGAVDNGRLSAREIVDLLLFMYTAGYDTSKNVLTLIMRQMIERPDLYERCGEDYDFCGRVVEEMLRYCSVSTSTRLTTQDVEYRDVLLPQGTMILFPVSVAGRDPGTFEDADRFDPDRPADPEHRHIAFGRGPHVCLGQHLARVQLQEGLHRIAQRIGEPKLAGKYGWRPFPGIWGLNGLPITFTPR
jgi:cytochrome P450